MAQRLVRENLHLMDERLRSTSDVSEMIMRILDSEVRVMRTLMAMNDVGVLSRVIPEWEHIVCRWQHVIYHTYTVDVRSSSWRSFADSGRGSTRGRCQS